MSNEGDVNQNISGNDNIQINSQNDTVAAIGDRAIATGGDLQINYYQIVEGDLVEAQRKIIDLQKDKIKNLEQKLLEFENENNFTTKIEIGNQANSIAKEVDVYSSGSLISLGCASRIAGHLELAKGQFKQALRIGQFESDLEHQAMALTNLGNLEATVENYPEAKEYLLQSLQIKQEIDDINGQINTYNSLGNVAFELGLLEESDNYFQSSLEMSDVIESQFGIAQATHGLAKNAQHTSSYDLAEMYYKRSAAMFRKIDYRRGLSFALANLGMLYINLGKAEESIDLLNESLIIDRENGDRLAEANTLHRLSIAYLELGNLSKSNIYKNLSNEIDEQV